MLLQKLWIPVKYITHQVLFPGSSNKTKVFLSERTPQLLQLGSAEGGCSSEVLGGNDRRNRSMPSLN